MTGFKKEHLSEAELLKTKMSSGLLVYLKLSLHIVEQIWNNVTECKIVKL